MSFASCRKKTENLKSMKKNTEITPAVEKIITEALAIEAESAQNAGALGFMARAMVQATLPHKRVEGNEFERKNGAFTLSLLAPRRLACPTVRCRACCWLG